MKSMRLLTIVLAGIFVIAYGTASFADDFTYDNDLLEMGINEYDSDEIQDTEIIEEYLGETEIEAEIFEEDIDEYERADDTDEPELIEEMSEISETAEEYIDRVSAETSYGLRNPRKEILA